MTHRQFSVGRVLVALVVPVALGTLLLGCGVPDDGRATVIENAELPQELSVPNASPQDRRSSEAASTATSSVVWVHDDDLVAAEVQEGKARSRHEQLTFVLAALVAGPTSADRERGRATALAPDATVDLIGVSGDTAIVDVDLGSAGPSADQLPLAIGQVVLSATSVPGIHRVEFQHAGKPLSAPLPDGGLKAGPLVRTDYVVLLRPTGSPR